MAELEDKFYAQKLLVDAQKRLEEEGWDFSKARKLVQGVSAHLGDTAWATKLLRDAAGRVQGFANLTLVAESAAELLPDRAAARTLVGEILSGWEQQLAAAAQKGAYDYSKLAAVKGRLLGDKDAAGAALDQAAELGGDHFAFAELARVAAEQGLADRVQPLLDKAAAACADAAQARQLANRLLASGFSAEQVRGVYEGLKGAMGGMADKLAWADGIVDLFGDRALARREYDALAASAQGAELAAVKERRARRA
jgi:hypothetical protein